MTDEYFYSYNYKYKYGTLQSIREENSFTRASNILKYDISGKYFIGVRGDYDKNSNVEVIILNNKGEIDSDKLENKYIIFNFYTGYLSEYKSYSEFKKELKKINIKRIRLHSNTFFDQLIYNTKYCFTWDWR